MVPELNRSMFPSFIDHLERARRSILTAHPNLAGQPGQTREKKTE